MSFIRLETQGIRNRVNVPRLKTNRSTGRKTHIFGRKNLGCNISPPPAPAGGIGLKPAETGSRWKSSQTWVIETKIIKAESRQKKADLHRYPDSQALSSPWSGGWGEGLPLSSVMLTLRVGMVFECRFWKLVKGVKFFFGMKVYLRILWHETWL